jgi:hypothetical protein
MTSFLMAAAISGIVAGAENSGSARSADFGNSSDVQMLDKHNCKGQNACKGQGGCKNSDKHACKGQNACKGQGGCKG